MNRMQQAIQQKLYENLKEDIRNSSKIQALSLIL
jgi:hypothetical protein